MTIADFRRTNSAQKTIPESRGVVSYRKICNGNDFKKNGFSTKKKTRSDRKRKSTGCEVVLGLRSGVLFEMKSIKGA